MSFTPFFLATLLASSFLCLLLNSWVMIWVSLEVNTLAFCAIMKSNSKEKKMGAEMSMKYFIIQSLSSCLLIFSVLVMKMHTSLSKSMMFLMIISIMIKMAASPFHQWFVLMVKKTVWDKSTILMTIQKLAPIYLILFSTKLFIYPFLTLSAFLGSVTQMNKNKLMEIMSLSSVFNLSWMMMAMIVNTKLFLLFSLIYWASVLIVMIFIHKTKIVTIFSEPLLLAKKWMLMIIFINLGGIPPMAGFLAKWLVFSESLSMKIVALTSVLLVTSSLNLYIYLRASANTLAKPNLSNQKMSKRQEKTITLGCLFFTLSPLVLVSIYSMRLKKGLFW